MRWLIRVALLLAVVAGLDRLAVGLVQGQLASRLQKAEHLEDRPAVHIGGFPFLTQVFGGTYRDLRIDVHGLTRDQLVLSDLNVKAEGVEVAFGDAVSGKVKQVPIQHGTVTARVTYSSIDAVFSAYGEGVVAIHTSPAGEGKMRLEGELTLPGGPYRVVGLANVSLARGRLEVTPVPDLISLLPAVIRSQATALLTPSISLPALPFHITLDSAAARVDGVVLRASAKGVVLRSTT